MLRGGQAGAARLHLINRVKWPTTERLLRAAGLHPLIGTWRLVSWENRSLVGGEIPYPLGKDAAGYVMYNQDGYMFVAIMGPDRLQFAVNDLLSGTPEEEAQAEETYISYCGWYDFDGDKVVHHVELSLFTNWVGVEAEVLTSRRRRHADKLTSGGASRSVLIAAFAQKVYTPYGCRAGREDAGR
jgi:hypothetical protein